MICSVLITASEIIKKKREEQKLLANGDVIKKETIRRNTKVNPGEELDNSVPDRAEHMGSSKKSKKAKKAT